MRKYAALLALWPGLVWSEQCVIQERTVTRAQVVIQERGHIRHDVVITPEGNRKCLVDFRVMIENKWHTRTATERVVVCKDRPELQEFKKVEVGQTGDVGQFRPHPNFPGRFKYNGAQCKWFLVPEFVGKDIHPTQGIICQTRPGSWVVVEKF